MPIAGLASAGLAVWIGPPAVMFASAVLYLLITSSVLRFAGGGIAHVVAASRVEFDAVAAAGRLISFTFSRIAAKTVDTPPSRG